MNIRIPDAAFAKLDRMEQYEQAQPEFLNSHIDEFMRDFVTCGVDPADWLYSEGVKGEWDLPYNHDVAKFLQSTAFTSLAGHFDTAGSDLFHQVMKRMAIDRFDALQAH